MGAAAPPVHRRHHLALRNATPSSTACTRSWPEVSGPYRATGLRQCAPVGTGEPGECGTNADTPLDRRRRLESLDLVESRNRPMLRAQSTARLRCTPHHRRRRSSARPRATPPLAAAGFGALPATFPGHREREGAGAERDLGVSGRAATMAEQCRLLVDGVRGDLDRTIAAARPNAPTVDWIGGSSSMGTPNRRHSSASHCAVARFMRLVREAVVTSVA